MRSLQLCLYLLVGSWATAKVNCDLCAVPYINKTNFWTKLHLLLSITVLVRHLKPGKIHCHLPMNDHIAQNQFIPQPIYFSQNSDSAVYLDVLKTTWVQLNSLSFPKSYYIYSHPISVDTKFIPQAAQGRNFRVIIVSYLSLTFNIYPSENSFGSTFKIYPESDVSHCLRCHHPHLNKYHLSHGLLQ